MLFELLEERVIYFKHFFTSQAKLFGLEQFNQTLAIYQLDWDYAFSIGFFLGIRTKPTCCKQNSFLSATHDGIPKISYILSADSLSYLLALEHHLRGEYMVQPQKTRSIYSSIVGFAGNHNLFQTMFVKESLAYTLKPSE